MALPGTTEPGCLGLGRRARPALESAHDVALDRLQTRSPMARPCQAADAIGPVYSGLQQPDLYSSTRCVEHKLLTQRIPRYDFPTTPSRLVLLLDNAQWLLLRNLSRIST